MIDRTVFIAGAAGEGVQTVGDVVARAFQTHGYAAFAYKEFESRIRGGRSSYRLRITETPVNAPCGTADILLAINADAGAQYRPDLHKSGWIVGSESDSGADFVIPFRSIAVEHGGEEIYANAAAAGALCAFLGLPLHPLNAALHATFDRRGAEIVAANIAVAAAGHALAETQLDSHGVSQLPYRPTRYALVNAHEAIAVSAAAVGCRFMAAYPMSPSTDIITYLTVHENLGVFTEQAEDEIAAINMALGASAAGARAMTATSGGGFALMVETVSLAGMIETPIVIVIGQRPGPATGLPTRTAQEDLLFAIRAGHGEFPRVVLAPSDPQDAIAKTRRAFDLADRYQTPVILLTDQFLADGLFSVDKSAIPDPPPSGIADPSLVASDYARYALTETGISPRLYFGQTEHPVVLDSDEHDEAGHLTEDLRFTRPAMVEKRLEKGRRLKWEMEPPETYRYDDAEVALIGWGSTRGAIAESVDRLRAAGHKAGSIHFGDLWPLPPFVFQDGIRYWTIEGNATGQLATLLTGEYGVRIEARVGRYDGLPLDAQTILKEWS